MNKCLALIIVLVAVGFFLRNHTISRDFPLTNLGRPKLFSVQDIPNLNGKVAIVTGANIGLGKASAQHLASHGATVILACRSQAKGEAAKKELVVGGIPENRLIVSQVDLSSLESVKQFVTRFHESKLPLHILMLNAGILASGYVLTKDGYEENFGVNYLSQFLLTKLLLPDLKKVKGSRIVGLSSHNHRESYEWGVSLTVEDINNQEKFHLYEAYSQSKLCMNLFMQELAERLSGDEVYPNAVNPGVVYTNILNPWFDANLGPLGLDFVSKIADAIIHLVAYSPEEAALSQVYLAVSPNVEKLNIRGKHFDPIATETDSHPHCKNKTLQKGLWEFSEKLTEKFQK